MKTLTKRLIPVFIVVCVCLTMMVGLASNAANPDLSAYTKKEMYDAEDTELLMWCPDVGGNIISTFTVEEGKQLNGFSLDCLPVGANFDLKIYSIPAAANCTWEDDQTAFKAAYATAIAGTPAFEALNQTCEDVNPAFSNLSQTNPWQITYGIKSYKFDEPLPAGTYAYVYTVKAANIFPVATQSLSDASGVVYYVFSNGDMERASSPVANRTSYYISDVPATTAPATTPAATDDFYYWDYEETLNDVGDRLNLVSKAAAGPDISEVDAVYVDGVIDNTSAIDLTSQRHATVNLDKAVTSFTFTSWVYLPAEYTSRFAYTTLMSAGSYDVLNSFVHIYFEQAATGYNLCAQVGDQAFLVNAVLDTDEWYHLAATYDMNTSTFKMYVDGVVVCEKVLTTSYTGLPENTPFYIGHQKYQWLFTDTLVDESVFAPSVWSADQIKDLYDDPAAAAASMKEILDPAPATTAPATTAPATNAPSGTNPGTGDMSIFLVLGAMIVMLTSVLTIVSVSKKKNY